MGSVVLAVVLACLGSSGLASVAIALMQRRWARKDKRQDDMATVKEALRYVLFDRIRYVGQAYIHAGKVDFDDRRILKQMHDVYHHKLGGNGDLDELMKAVEELPLR